MADRDPSTFGKVCPSCGRRVPRTVTQCRCGADLPAESGAASVVDEDEPRGSSPWLVFPIIILLVGTTAYWTFFRRPAATAAAETPAFLSSSDSGAPPAAGGAKRELTPEQRAWDAAARMKEADPDQPAKDAADPVPIKDEPLTTPALEDMVDRAMPSIVLVEASTGRGSAFFVQHDTLITNVHVVQNDGYVTLRRMDGSSVNARVHTRAPNFDIAVLKVAQSSPSQPFLPMATAQGLKPGQEVVVIGSALGTLQNSVSRGIVSGLRNSSGVNLIQSDAAANPGNSGGPMLDRSGRVVGILTAGYRGQQGLNFAVAIDHARDILDGRQTNLGSGQTGFGNIESTPTGGQQSESDRRQQQGEQEFVRRVGAAEEGAGQLDAGWQRFRSVCFKNRIAGSYDREWFALYVPGAIPSDAAAGCIDYFQSMSTQANKFRDYMRSAVQDARRANVLPGTIRDTLRQKRLFFDGW